MDWRSIVEQSTNFYKDVHNTNLEYYHLWMDHILFTWKWWLAVSSLLLPWIIWLIFRKKESQDRLLYVGFFIIVVSSALDTTGLGLSLWCYPITIFPIIHGFAKYDISILPVSTMLFIQILPKYTQL